MRVFIILVFLLIFLNKVDATSITGKFIVNSTNVTHNEIAENKITTKAVFIDTIKDYFNGLIRKIKMFFK